MSQEHDRAPDRQASLLPALYGEQELGPDQARNLDQDPALASFRTDLEDLRSLHVEALAVDRERMQPPPNALLLAVQAFEAEAPKGWLERSGWSEWLRSGFLVPAASLALVAFLVWPSAGTAPGWQNERLEAGFQELASDLAAIDSELRPFETAQRDEERTSSSLWTVLETSRSLDQELSEVLSAIRPGRGTETPVGTEEAIGSGEEGDPLRSSEEALEALEEDLGEWLQEWKRL